ncbi:hypothetical protein Hanom_Chr00s003797g01715901 [Helianthus anomalus]
MDVREIEWGWYEIEKKKSSEKDWPHKDHVDCNVNWVAVISCIKGKVFFKIKKPHLKVW